MPDNWRWRATQIDGLGELAPESARRTRAKKRIRWTETVLIVVMRILF